MAILTALGGKYVADRRCYPIITPLSLLLLSAPVSAAVAAAAFLEVSFAMVPSLNREKKLYFGGPPKWICFPKPDQSRILAFLSVIENVSLQMGAFHFCFQHAGGIKEY